MAHGGAHHHGDRHATDGADAEEVRRGGLGGEAQRSGGGCGEAEGHEEIGQVQHQQQRRAPGFVAAPACEADEVERGCKGAEDRRRKRLGRGDPGQEGQCADGQGCGIEAVEGHRQGGGAALGQPVAGEAGHDAPADQKDEEDQQGDAGAVAVPGGAAPGRLGMVGDIGEPEQADRHQHLEVAPVVSGDDFARDHRGDGEEEGLVDEGRCQRPEAADPDHGEASGQPERQQRRQRPAAGRQAPCPVGHGGEEEASHHRGAIAVDHFVYVPVGGVERARERHAPRPDQPPERDHPEREERGSEEERPEAVGEEGGAAIGGGGGHERQSGLETGTGGTSRRRPAVEFEGNWDYSTWAKRSAIRPFALPLCVTAEASSRFTAAPTWTRAIMPMA